MYPIAYAKTSLYGDSIRFEELGNSLQQDAGATTMIGLGLVFVVASILYMSFRVGIISLVPIIISVLWAVGLMGFLKVPFTSLSTGIISLVLGVGVDFSIHLVDSIQKEFDKGKDTERAISEALFTSGSAILLSSFTTFFGFLALTFAQLLGTQRLGFSLAFSIISVFFVSITLVPAIMSLTRDMKIQNLFKAKKTQKTNKRKITT
jgi:predicted RND superfamily exporter protein